MDRPALDVIYLTILWLFCHSEPSAIVEIQVDGGGRRAVTLPSRCASVAFARSPPSPVSLPLLIPPAVCCAIRFASQILRAIVSATEEAIL